MVILILKRPLSLGMYKGHSLRSTSSSGCRTKTVLPRNVPRKSETFGQAHPEFILYKELSPAHILVQKSLSIRIRRRGFFYISVPERYIT
jgi:hypothetical protein